MAKKKIELSDEVLNDAASRVADMLNLTHWFLQEHNLPPEAAIAMFDAAGRAMFIEHNMCLCDECVDAQMKKYRHDIKERYECDEPIEADYSGSLPAMGSCK
jgi:hypothetical protein